MKKIIKTQILKKLFSSVLPLAFLFVTTCQGNIAHAAFSTVNALPDSTDGSLTDIKSGGTRNFTGYNNSTGKSGGKGMLAYNNDTSTLTLTDIDISTTNGLFEATGSGAEDILIINLVGENKISSSKATIKLTSGSIKFTGSGSLTINQTGAYSAISTLTAGNIEFAQAGKIAITHGSNSAAIATAAATDSITITSGSLSVTKSDQGSAIDSKGPFNLNGGTVSLTESSGTSGEALSVAKECNLNSGSLTIIQKSNNSALKVTEAFKMSGGAVKIEQTGDAIAMDLSGAVTVSGGTLTVSQSAAKNAIKSASTYTQTLGSIIVNQNGGDNAMSFEGAFTMEGGYIESINTADTQGALHFKDDASISGGRIKARINNETNTNSPIYVDASKRLTVSNAVISSLGGTKSPYGIDGNSGSKIEIYKGQIEAFGNTNAINPTYLTLSSDVDWTALVGASSSETTEIHPKTITDLGSYDYVKLYNASTLASATSVFDKNTAAKEHTEITVKLTLNGNKLTGISLGKTQLTSGKEFTENMVSGSSDIESVTLEVREFLDSLAVGTHTLTFAFDNGTSAAFTLEVVDTAQSSDTTQSNDATQKDEVPKTGDQSNVMLYVLLLSAGLFSIILANKKKLFNK